MNLDERMEDSKTFSTFRTSLDIGMGAVYIIIGVVALSVRYFGVMELTTVQSYVLGIALILYGAFRIYRGMVAIRRRR